MYLSEMGFNIAGWIEMAQDGIKWCPGLYKVMDL
jgi:hypothetical protein